MLTGASRVLALYLIRKSLCLNDGFMPKLRGVCRECKNSEAKGAQEPPRGEWNDVRWNFGWIRRRFFLFFSVRCMSTMVVVTKAAEIARTARYLSYYRSTKLEHWEKRREGVHRTDDWLFSWMGGWTSETVLLLHVGYVSNTLPTSPNWEFWALAGAWDTGQESLG